MTDTRCVSKVVYRSGAFTDLPLSTQGLYTQLMLEADNRGYVQGAKNLVRYFSASIDELKLLTAKNFLIPRDDYFDLVLITHFRINNSLKADRFKETVFIEDFKNIFLTSEGAYTLIDTGIRAINQPINNGGRFISQVWNHIGTSLEPQNKIKENKVKETKINQSKYKSKEIELDKTRYKHFEKCEELVEKLIASTYISEKELDLEDYFAYLDNLLDEYSTIDVKVKVDYFIKQVSVVIPTNDNKFTYRLIEGIEGIKCKFLYFKTAIDKAFKEINKNNLGAIYEL